MSVEQAIGSAGKDTLNSEIKVNVLNCSITWRHSPHSGRYSYSLFLFLVLLSLCGTGLFAQDPNQSTNIGIGDSTIQPSVKRLGINLGTLTFYDSGQTLQNLVMQNPGFEGQIWNSTIRCASGTPTSCVDEDQWSGWTAGFWNGATFEVFSGAAAGRTGTVTTSTAPGGGQGVTLNFGSSGVAPANGDYLIVRKTIPGGSAGGWWPVTSGAGVIGDNLTDLPPGTLGKQTTVLTAPTASDAASIAGYFDSTTGKTFLQLNGSYQLQFKAKGVGGSNQINVQVERAGVATYFSQVVPLTDSWNTYSFTFTAGEDGTAIGTAGLIFATVGADSFELDDVSLTKTNGDPTNTTMFRDPVVNALRALQPGTLRYWGGQLGDTLDNLLMPQFGRQRAGYLAWYTESDVLDYGLQDYLALCQAVGAEPWFVVPTTFSTTDASNLIEYLAGDSTTPYGAKRTALGQTAPWTQVFSKIHLEFGNEAWNSTFKGGSIEYSEPYGARAQEIFGVMRAHPLFISSNFDLILGGQAVWAARNTDIQNNCNNNDSFAVASYTMGQIDSYSDNESLFGPTFAEPEAFMSSSGSTEGLTPGMIYQDYQAIQASSRPVPLSFYEINMGTMGGAITQAALDGYTPSLGAGLMVADTMLQALKQFGVVNQNLFALPQYSFNRPDGKNSWLWGSVVDMGVTDRKRPQFLALQLANQALSNGAAMLQTVHSGADPTWNQPLLNQVQFNGAHYVQSYAFSQGVTRSAIVFNLSRNASLPVTFSGANAPSGTVQMQQLTSANPTDTNENASVVNIVPSTLSGFNPASGLSLPPYSMTVLTWSTASTGQAPAISSVAAGSITGTSAIVTWVTDQAASSLVNYGTTTAYGSSSAMNATLANSHSAMLTGLTPGTKYDYQVVSANSTGISANSANFTFSTPLPVPVISSVATSGITTTSATVSWTTDQACSSQVQYGASSSYGSLSPMSSTLTTSHSVTLTGLTPGTTYSYDVLSANAGGVSTSSANFTFSTPLPAPLISSVLATGISGTQATISWTTDQATTSLVNYGTTTAYGAASPLNSSLVTRHSVTLTGLTAGATYNFDVVSANSANSTATSPNTTFTTISTPTPPFVGYVAFWGISDSGITISWSSSMPATTQLAYGTTTALGQLSPLQAALTSSHGVVLTGLSSGTKYYFVAQSTAANGATGYSTIYSFTTGGVAAIQGPVISSVTATGLTSSSATIIWRTNQLTSSLVNYGTTSSYGSASTRAPNLVIQHSVTLTGLTPATTYDYAVTSTNLAGTAAISANFTFTTVTAPVPPPAPLPPSAPAPSAGPAPQVGYLQFWGITSSSIIISWSTDLPATSAVAYGTTSALGQISTVQTALTNNHGITLTGLSSGTTYYFVAQSTGANGKTGSSTVYSFTTTSTAAPTISGIVVVPGSNGQAQISWQTAVPANSYVQFGSTTIYNNWSTTTALTTSPQVSLSWLPSGIVHYQLVSTDAHGNQSVSPDCTFIEP